jgi:hypothetical protein
VLPLASFEQEGQKIRSPSQVLDGGVGTCLDTALLFAAALEQAGLNPVLLMTKGPAFAGVWLPSRTSEWLAGPPCIVDEVVFDEREMERCYLTQEDAILATKHAHESSGHPGYSSEALGIMTEAEFGEETGKYPHSRVFRFDRRRADGEILHPYAARRDGQDWAVLVHLPFLSTFEDVPEADFITMPIASLIPGASLGYSGGSIQRKVTRLSGMTRLTGEVTRLTGERQLAGRPGTCRLVGIVYIIYIMRNYR